MMFVAPLIHCHHFFHKRQPKQQLLSIFPEFAIPHNRIVSLVSSTAVTRESSPDADGVVLDDLMGDATDDVSSQF